MTEDLRDGGRPQTADQRQDDQHGGEHAVVQREDAQHAPHIEIAEVMRRLFRAPEDRRDEESGKHEDEIDAGPAGIRDLEVERANPAIRIGNREEVKHRHEQNRGAAEAVERWDPCVVHPSATLT